MIRGIVFDLWNCLAHDPGPQNPMHLLGDALGIRGQPGWRRRLERGMMLAPADDIEGGLRQIAAREGLAPPDEASRGALVAAWNDACRGAALYPDVLPALDRLRGRHRLGLASNTQSFGLGFLEPLWDRLDASALSFEVGLLKPRREIFHTVCSRLGLSPDTVLMVGDHRRDDIAGARSAGLWALRIARQDRAASHQEAPGAVEGEDAPLQGLDQLPGRIEAINRAS